MTVSMWLQVAGIICWSVAIFCLARAQWLRHKSRVDARRILEYMRGNLQELVEIHGPAQVQYWFDEALRRSK